MMKRITLLLIALCMASVTIAQRVVLSDSTFVRPKYEGSDVQRFMVRLAGEFEKLAVESEIPATDLSLQVALALEIDKQGRVAEIRYLDNTCEGIDKQDLAPATEATRGLIARAMERLDRWTPAQRDGVAEAYTCRMIVRLPIEKIARKQDADPLLFMGEDPAKSFHTWARIRIPYQNYATRSVEGFVHIRFYIEPDGRITIGDIVASPDAKLSREVIRAIRLSKGKWTPKKVRGVPQRAAYDYRVNYSAN